MTEEIKLSASARSDLADLWQHVLQYDRATADRTLDSIYRDFTLLSLNPRMGKVRPEFFESLRSFVSGNYLIFYFEAQAGVLVYRVLHAARDLRGFSKKQIFYYFSEPLTTPLFKLDAPIVAG